MAEFRSKLVITQLGDPQTDGIKTPRGVIQDYDAIKQQCLASGRLFEDPIFSPRGSKRSECVWLRPFEISGTPKFVSSGISRFDVIQGELGDCWLVAAVANLTLNAKLFALVVPPDQSFDRGAYCGLFRFRFWQFGKWVEVIIDDRLPTRDGKLLFMRSSDPDEFWSPLFEKAYAKLHGSYDALRGGTTCEAMVDLTGGVTEFFDIQTAEAPPNLYAIIKKAFERGSLIGCSIEAQDESQRENELPNGLIKGHAYSITFVLDLDVYGRTIPMLRLRNPWSGSSEWNGPWSDKSREWSRISDYEKKRIGLNFDADGEFWITFEDFKENFTRVEFCNLTLDGMDSDRQRKWHQQIFEGSWIRGQTAGGCRNNLETFAMNPQYLITLVDPDEDDDEENCTMIVALMQKNKRSAKKYQMGSSELTIGFAIYAVNDEVYRQVGSSPQFRQSQQLLNTDFFKYNCSVARSPTYINLREVTCRFSLKPGVYCIIPSTFDRSEEGSFILRVWTEMPVKAAAPGQYPELPQPLPQPTRPVEPTPKPEPSPPSPTPAYPRYPTPPKPDVTPAYPAYPSYPPAVGPTYPAVPPFGGGGDIRYPTMPEEPSIIRRNVPKPPPAPSNIDIDIGEVIGTVSAIVSILTMCWSAYQRMTATSQTYPYNQQQRSGGLFQEPQYRQQSGYSMQSENKRKTDTKGERNESTKIKTITTRTTISSTTTGNNNRHSDNNSSSRL